MRFLILLAALALWVAPVSAKKGPEWHQGRVKNMSEQKLPPTLSGPTPENPARQGGGVGIPTVQIRQTLAVEAGDEVYLVEMVCLEGQEVEFSQDGSVTYAITKKDFLIKDQGGRVRKFEITWHGPKSKAPARH